MTEKEEAVQRMQDYIAAHLTERITLADLSEAACYSPWYSARLFKELTGSAPADYIRRLKLSKSALRLRDETCRIIDVAYDMGFGSVDGYQRAFFREFGCNPKRICDESYSTVFVHSFWRKFRELWKETSNMENIRNIFIQVIDKTFSKVIIKRGQNATDY